MPGDVPFDRILFIDIETVPLYPEYDQAPESLRKLWGRKAEYIRHKEDDPPEKVYERAGIYAEFGKVICIGAGFFHQNEFRVKSFFGDTALP